MSDFKDDIERMLRSLTAREKAALKSRFEILLDDNISIEDVGKQFDITRQKIRNIERKALKKLGQDLPEIDYEAEQSCSFCGKYKREVSKMIEASSGVGICEECVLLAKEIVDQEDRDE